MSPRRPRVGILNAAGVVGWGGGFQYMLSLIEGIRESADLDVVVYYEDPAFEPFRFAAPNYTWVHLARRGEMVGRLARTIATFANVRSPWLGRYEVMRQHDLDLLVSASSLVGFHLGIPFLGIVYDVTHKYFPDASNYPIAERVARDVINSRMAQHAVFTVVDSERGKQDLVRFYRANAARVRPVQLCPPPHVYRSGANAAAEAEEVRRRYQLPARFLFYPAQLWEHKNHLRLLQALALLRTRNSIEIPAILAGSSWGRADLVRRQIAELSLGSLVTYLGYLPQEDMAAIYRSATALVFPSFGDYTNIPVLEAMALGTPVLCSNAFAMPEQVGDAGLLFDPFDVEDMAAQIRRVWTDRALRESLIARGTRRVEELSLANFGRRWLGLIREALEPNGRLGEAS